MIKLDLGCGNNKMRDSIGIDILTNSDCDILADILNLPIRRGVIDLIKSYEVFEHLKSPFYALRECRRVLKMFGFLVISIPNVMFYRAFLRWSFKSKITVANEHIYGWRLSEIENLLRTNYFEIVNFDFLTFKRYHKRNIIEKALSKYYPNIFEKSLRVISQRC